MEIPVKSIYINSARILSALLFTGVVVTSFAVTAEKIEAQSAPMEISVQDFEKAYKANPKVPLLDVRTSGEYRSEHVPNGVNLDVNDLMNLGPKASAKIPFPKDKTIYVICRSGNRSMTATKVLRSMGYTKAVSVSGGTMAWQRLGHNCGQLLACAK
jgi:rhodanese-related sulfurtransferase